MQNLNITEVDAFANEMKVDLHMFSSLLLDQVGGEVHRADVVAVDDRSMSW